MLSEKTIIVTGGASGIGRGIALVAARHNARAVIVADLLESPKEGGESVVDTIRRDGGRAEFVKVDVRDRLQVEAMIAAAAPFGGVDVMACNAGIAAPDDGPFVPAGTWDMLLSVNLTGVLHCAQAAAKDMLDRGRAGSIVLTSSMGGLRGASATVGYSTTKGGLNVLAFSLAAAWGPSGIRVNAVCPGLIDTALVQSSPGVAAVMEELRQRMPLRRLAQPAEVGEAVAWLGSDLSSFVTGVALPVDGGLTSSL